MGLFVVLNATCHCNPNVTTPLHDAQIGTQCTRLAYARVTHAPPSQTQTSSVIPLRRWMDDGRSKHAFADLRIPACVLERPQGRPLFTYIDPATKEWLGSGKNSVGTGRYVLHPESTPYHMTEGPDAR